MKYFEEDFIGFLGFAKTLKVHHPVHGFVNLEIQPYLERYVASIFNYRCVIGKKFRQGGFSTITAAYAYWFAKNHPDTTTLILTNTDRQGISIINTIGSFNQTEPSCYSNNVINFNNGSRIYAGPYQIVCGKSISLLIIDEAAFIDGMENIWLGLYPVVKNEGKVIVCSTTNGTKNWFYKTYKNAIEGKNNFFAYECCYYEHSNYKNNIDEVRKNMDEHTFKQEILCEFVDRKPPTKTLQDFLNELTCEQQEKLKNIFKSML